MGLGQLPKVERNLAGQNWFGGRNRNNGVFESCTADTVPSGWAGLMTWHTTQDRFCVPQRFFAKIRSRSMWASAQEATLQTDRLKAGQKMYCVRDRPLRGAGSPK